MTVAALQNAFADYLVDRSDGVKSLVKRDGLDGLAVYHNAYRVQLVACLRDSYERVWAWLGDDAFDQAARAHIARQSPHSWTLGAYGDGFGLTLMRLFPADRETADLATIDWAMRRAFDGPDAVPVAPERLGAVDWDRAVIRLAPTLSLIVVETNAAAIWTALRNGDMPPVATASDAPLTVRVWRQEFSPRFATVAENEVITLKSVMAGSTFSAMCARLSKAIGVEAATESVGSLLAGWLRDDLIVAIED